MQPEGESAPQPSGESNLNMLAIGQYVGNGRYELLRMLDKGGMSSVWLAIDSRLHEKVALKFLPPEISRDPAALREMQRETTKSRQLSHPNIIRIYDLHESPDEAPFISMEFIEGENLHYLIQRQQQGIFTWEQIKPWVKQLCDALTYAHGEGVIHRDLKPANMMLDAKGRLKLADFGIAMSVNESKKKSDVVLVSGTPAYMSPQQHSGQPAHITDDIYSLGATLYELLASRPPFYTGDIKIQVMNEPPSALTNRLWELGLTNDIPPDVSALIMACLGKYPAQRPANAQQVAQWIGLKDEPVSGWANSSKTETVIADETQTSGAKTEHSKEKSKLVWLVLAGVLLIPLAAILWVLFASKPEAPEKESLFYPSSHALLTNATSLSNGASIAKTQPGSATNSGQQMVAIKSFPKKSPGTLDETFSPQAGPNKVVFASARQTDGKYVVGGDFTKVGEVNCTRIARFNPDGSPDLSFSKYGIINDEIYVITLQPDGKIFIGGKFTTVYGNRQEHLARLNQDGSLDKSFATKVPNYVSSIAILPDGKALISGRFTRVEPPGMVRNRIARLHPNGYPDESFNPGTGGDDDIDRILMQPDGRILIAGNFTKINGIPCSRIARLMPNGNLDTSFNAKAGLNGNVLALVLQADGKILVGGRFTSFNNASANYIVRLNPNGTRDMTFNIGSGANAFVGSVRLDGGGKIWVGGDFTDFNGLSCGHLIRLNLDGARDPSFSIGMGANGAVRSLAYIPGEGMLIGGNFTSFDGVSRPRIARLYTSVPASSKD